MKGEEVMKRITLDNIGKNLPERCIIQYLPFRF